MLKIQNPESPINGDESRPLLSKKKENSSAFENNDSLIDAINSGLLAKLGVIFCAELKGNTQVIQDTKNIDGNKIWLILNSLPDQIKNKEEQKEIKKVLKTLNDYADTIVSSVLPSSMQANFRKKETTHLTFANIASQTWAIIAALLLCLTIGYMEFKSAKDLVSEAALMFVLAAVLIILAIPAGAPLAYANNKSLAKKIFREPLADGQNKSSITKRDIIVMLLTAAIFGIHGVATGLINSDNTEEFYALSGIERLETAGRYLGLIPIALGNAIFIKDMFYRSIGEDKYMFFGARKNRHGSFSTLSEDLLGCTPSSHSEKAIRDKILAHLKNRCNRINASNNLEIQRIQADELKKFLKNRANNLAALIALNLQDASVANLPRYKFFIFWLSSVLLGGCIGTISSLYVKDLAPKTFQKILMDFGVGKEAAEEASKISGMVALVCTSFMTTLALKTSFFKKLFQRDGLSGMIKPNTSWLLNVPAFGLAATMIALTLSADSGSTLWLAMLISASILVQTVLSRLGLDSVLSDFNLRQMDPRDQLSQSTDRMYHFFEKLNTPLLTCYYAILRATECALENPNIGEEKIKTELEDALKRIASENSEQDEVVCLRM